LIAAVVLAAGLGTRFAGPIPKPLVPLAGRALLAYALDAARASGLAPVVLVASDGVVATVAAVVAPESVIVVRNEAPERGIASSLQCALRALADRDEVDAVVVGLADQPLVGPGAYQRVGAAYAGGARLAFATYHGQRGNPVLVARDHWDEALTLTGDEGARVLFRRHPAVAVPCDGTGSPDDVDTPEDLTRLESQWRSQTASE
jgi:nicotine blue oxidoreductase